MLRRHLLVDSLQAGDRRRQRNKVPRITHRRLTPLMVASLQALQRHEDVVVIRARKPARDVWRLPTDEELAGSAA